MTKKVKQQTDQGGPDPAIEAKSAPKKKRATRKTTTAKKKQSKSKIPPSPPPTPEQIEANLRRALNEHLPVEELVLAICEGLNATKAGRASDEKDEGVPDYSIRERYLKIGLEYQVGKSVAREHITFRKKLDLKDLEEKCRKPAYRDAMKKVLEGLDVEDGE